MGDRKSGGREVNLITACLVSVAMVASGILLFFWTWRTMRILAVVIGIGAMVFGIRSLILSKDAKDPTLKKSMLVKALIMIVVAALMIAFPSLLYRLHVNVWRFLIYIAAFMLISTGILAIAQALMFDTEGWKGSLVFEGCLSIVAGFALLPDVLARFMGVFVLKFFGVALVVLGVCYFVSCYNRRYDLKEVS